MAYKDEHTLYLLKFNNDSDMLYDECGNKWTIGKFYTEEFLRPNVSTENTLLSYPSLAVTGTNYLETDAYNFNLNNNTWTIDFWVYVPKLNTSLTYLSVRGDVLIVKYNKIYIKTEDGNTIEIYNKVLLNKWFHFALVKHYNFISVYINGTIISYIKLSSKIKEYSDNYPNIISLGKSITNIGLRSPYNIIQFRISSNARFNIDKSFNPLTTLGFLNFVKRKVQKTITKSRTSLKYELKLENKQFSHNIYREIFTTTKVYQNIKRILKRRFYQMKSDLKRRVLQLQLNIPIETFLSNGAINLTSTCLNIQKNITTSSELERNVKIPGYLLYHRKYLYDPYLFSNEPIYIMHSQFLFDVERRVYRLNKIIGPTYVPKTPDEDSKYLYYIPFPKVITPSEYDDLYEDDPEIFNYYYIRPLQVYLSTDTVRRTYKFEQEEYISSDPFKIKPTLYDDLYIKSPNKIRYIYAGFYTKTDLIRKVYRIEKIIEPSAEPFKIVLTDYDNKYEYDPLDSYYANSDFKITIQVKNDLVRKVYYIKEEYIKHEIRLTEYDKKYEYDFSFGKENKILLANIFNKFNTCREVYKEIHVEDNYIPHTITLSEYDKKYEYDELNDDEILRAGCIFTLQIEIDLVRNVYKEIHAEDNYIPHTIVPTAYDNEYEFLPLLAESIILKRIYITSKIDLIRKVYQKITVFEEDKVKEIIPSEYDKKYEYDELNDDEILRADYTLTLQLDSDLIRKVYREKVVSENEDSTTSIANIIIPSEYDNKYEYDPINKLLLSSHIYNALKSDLIRKVYREKVVSENEDSTTSITNIIIPSEYDNKYEYDDLDDDRILRAGCIVTLQIEIDLIRNVENKPLFEFPPIEYKIRLDTEYHKRYRYNPIKPINKTFEIRLYTESKRKVYKIQPLDISDYLTNTNVITDIVETLYDDNGNLISYTRVFNHKITEYDKKYFKDTEILKPSMQVYMEVEFDTARIVQQLILKDKEYKKSIMENILDKLNYNNVNFAYPYIPFKNVELYLQEFYDTCRTSNIDKIINLNSVLTSENISNIEYDMNGNIMRYDRTFIPTKSQYDLKYEKVPDAIIIKLITIVEEFDTIRKIDKILDIDVNKNTPKVITKSSYDNEYEFFPIYNDKINKEITLTLIYDTVRKVIISLKDNDDNNMLLPFKPMISEYDKKYIEDTEVIKNYIIIKIVEEFDTIRKIDKILDIDVNKNTPKVITKSSYDNEYEFSPIYNIITKHIYLKISYDIIRKISDTTDNNKEQQNSAINYKTLIHILEEFETKRVNKLTNVYPLYDVGQSLYDQQYCFDKDYNPN